MTNPSCIFCKIIRREMPARIVHDDASCIAFHDIHPQAPVHLLVIPRKHFSSAAEAAPEDAELLGRLHLLAAELARKHGIASGYRVVTNTGAAAGQTVFHLHLHVLGGRSFAWPPG